MTAAVAPVIALALTQEDVESLTFALERMVEDTAAFADRMRTKGNLEAAEYHDRRADTYDALRCRLAAALYAHRRNLTQINHTQEAQ
jgi:hypothetical protein